MAAALETFAADFMCGLAAADTIFRYPVSRAATLEGVLAEIVPEIAFAGEVTSPEEGRETGADAKYLLRTHKACDVHVYLTQDEVWLDVSRLGEGEGGSGVYTAVADFALNTGREFIGDPAGLTDVALRRRTEAMLSSALKHGTSDHLRPHPRQVAGDLALGVPPLEWVMGDTSGNIQRLIGVSLSALAHYLPELLLARYDFAAGAFRNPQGERLSDEDFERWGHRHRGARAAGAGRASLKRGILLNTLLRAESGARPGLLEQVLREPGKLVGRQLFDIFY